jgi:hypothetical protein
MEPSRSLLQMSTHRKPTLFAIGEIPSADKLISQPLGTISALADYLRESLDRSLNPPPLHRLYSASVEKAFERLSGQEKICLEEVSPAEEFHPILSAIIQQLTVDSVPKSLWKDWPSPGWSQILRLLYGITRHFRPKVVLETGVGVIGSTSAVILAALTANDEGHLLSIDRDRPKQFFDVPTGSGIPKKFRPRHTLLLGSSNAWLSRLLAEDVTIDMFLHDSLHTRRQMTVEYEQVWPMLRSGGVLASDDTWNCAFDDFTNAKSCIGTHLRYDNSSFGLSRKPSQ